MNITITGSSEHYYLHKEGAPHTRVWSSIRVLKLIFQELGYTITECPPDKVPDSSDIVIVGISRPGFRTSIALPHALLTLHQWGNRAIMEVGALTEVLSGYSLERHLRRFPSPRRFRPLSATELELAAESLEGWRSKRLSCHAHFWADTTGFMHEYGVTKPIFWDPSAFSPRYPVLGGPRERSWVYGHIYPTRDGWMSRLQWPLVEFGHRNFLPEHELVALYGRHWGVMSHAFPGTEFGWWRHRITQATRAGSLVGFAPGDQRPFAYPAPATIEQLNNNELAILASYYQGIMSLWPTREAVFQLWEDELCS